MQKQSYLPPHNRHLVFKSSLVKSFVSLYLENKQFIVNNPFIFSYIFSMQIHQYHNMHIHIYPHYNNFWKLQIEY